MLSESFKKYLTLFFIFLLVILLVIQFERFFNREGLTLYNFRNDDKIVVKQDFYDLKGETSSIKKLFLNNKEYYLDENEKFNIRLYLFSGFNNFYIKAITESGKNFEKNIVIFNE